MLGSFGDEGGLGGLPLPPVIPRGGGRDGGRTTGGPPDRPRIPPITPPSS